MKVFIGLLLALISSMALAEEATETSKTEAAKEDAKKIEWQNTTISDATIKKVQEAKYEYNKCVVNEMKKAIYIKVDSRNATESIIKVCEPILSNIRTVYLEEKIPEVIADRHLKQMRTQTTRNVLQQMMFNDAARKSAGQP